MKKYPLELFKFTEEKSALVEEILSITGRSGIGWHYCLDYYFALDHFDPNVHHRILDVGCGPYGNALHDYLEKVYGKDVYGLDRQLPRHTSWEQIKHSVNPLIRGETSISSEVDWAGDFMEFMDGDWDLILAISSLEHNQPHITQDNWMHATELLADDGILIATFSIAGDAVSKWNENTNAMDLSLTDAETVWGCEFTEDFDKTVATYEHPYLRNQYIRRFGQEWNDVPPYVAAGTIKTR
jgi:SAM-dependent methyltransferase